jgi:hypothetical protein
VRDRVLFEKFPSDTKKGKKRGRDGYDAINVLTRAMSTDDYELAKKLFQMIKPMAKAKVVNFGSWENLIHYTAAVLNIDNFHAFRIVQSLRDYGAIKVEPSTGLVFLLVDDLPA